MGSDPLLHHPELYRLLVEAMHEGLGVRDRRGTIVYVNPRLCAMLGYRQEEIVGRPVTALLDDASRRRFAAESEQRRLGMASSYELTMVHKSGRKVPTLQSGNAILGADGAYLGSVAVITDLSSLATQRALKLSEERYRRLFDEVPVGVYRSTADGRLVEANRALVELFACADRDDALGREIGSFFADPEDHRRWRQRMDEAEQVRDFEVRLRRADGTELWARTNAHALSDPHGERIGYAGTIEDVTDRKAAEDTRRSSEERLRALVQNASDLISIVDPGGKLLYDSPSHARILGYPLEERQGASVFDHVHPDDAEEIRRLFHQLVERPGTSVRTELRLRHHDGRWRVLECVGTNLLDNPAVGGVVINSRDVTERRRAEEQLLHDALHDALTGLPNRALFMDRLEHALGRTSRTPAYRCAVLFLDLDRFKTVNDSLGHAVGDRLLVQASQRLHGCLRPTDTLARLGGDEFAVLLEDVGEASQAVRVAERMQQALERPFDLLGREVYTTASIGIALSAPGSSAPEELLRDADTAMYRAKGDGRSSYAVFDARMHAQALSQLQLETDLRRAIDRWQFRLFYQPIVALESGALLGLEALVRWRHPELGLILPREFVPTAEETGLIGPLGSRILAEACRRMQAWIDGDSAAGALFVAVNLSNRQLGQGGLVAEVEGALERSGLAAANLILEVTESAVMQHPTAIRPAFQRLKELGIRLSLDDFGTGHSSLSVLHQFPFDLVKIARSFVGNLGVDRRSDALLRGIVGLCQGCRLATVAEGVETAAQRDGLRAMGCEQAQGLLFSPPLPEADAERLLRSRPARVGG